ncbi:hypothetical protein ACOI22_03650 [Glaciecola sp. 2405UD65-10]|uniref:hypothetical protein n=1 Tax=Glaciecola sp. 2405UD65-10 TaxID=3397244 RepID=UPI003B5A109D
MNNYYGNAATHNLDDSTDLNTGKSIAKRPPFKLEISLLLFLRLGKEGMNGPEAYQAYGESCLNTTVSTLQNERGICFCRRSEQWTHRHNGKTHFHRYWLADGKAELMAISLLNELRNKRGMYPIQPRDYYNLPNKAA